MTEEHKLSTPIDPIGAHDAAQTQPDDAPQAGDEPAWNDGTQATDEPHEGHEALDERLERLGGEPAPAITPEEFARLQQAGQVHIDSRGRVRTVRPGDVEGGVSLRKRRAWYGRRRPT